MAKIRGVVKRSRADRGRTVGPGIGGVGAGGSIPRHADRDHTS